MKSDSHGQQRSQDRTKDYALSVIRLFAALPKRTETQVLGRQLLRAGTSVGAQYREATRAKSNADFISGCVLFGVDKFLVDLFLDKKKAPMAERRLQKLVQAIPFKQKRSDADWLYA